MGLEWADVVTIAGALPEVAESTSWGTPSLKVSGHLMARLRTEDDGTLALKCTAADKEALVTGPDPAFSTIPHYDGYDYVLVDLDRVDPDELAELIHDAWRIAAPARLRRLDP